MPNESGNAFTTELTAPVTEKIETEVSETSEEEVSTEQSETEVKEEYIPKRLRGKTKAEIYKEFAGLEQDYSRMGNELGESRALLRETLEKALTAKEAEPEITEEEILANPKESLSKLIDEKLKPIKDAAISSEQRYMIQEFNIRHPGYQETAKSPEFRDWLSESKYRTRQFMAASNFDMDAAEDLITAFEDYKKSGVPTDDSATEKRRDIRRASTETGGAGKVPSKSGKKIYRSVELSRLYNIDRERYNEMMPEIKLAFQEGRVK